MCFGGGEGGLKTETNKFLLHFQNSKLSNRCWSIYGTNIITAVISMAFDQQHAGNMYLPNYFNVVIGAQPLPSALSCHNNIMVNCWDVPMVNRTWLINIHK